MFLLKSFSAILLAMTCVKAQDPPESHMITTTIDDKCITFVGSLLNPFSLTREIAHWEAAMATYEMDVLNGMTSHNLLSY